MIYHFTQDELREMGASLADLEIKKSEVEEVKKSATKELNEKIKSPECEIENLSQKINVGYETREDNLFNKPQEPDESPEPAEVEQPA